MCPRIPVIDARLGNRNNKFLLKFMCFSIDSFHFVSKFLFAGIVLANHK